MRWFDVVMIGHGRGPLSDRPRPSRPSWRSLRRRAGRARTRSEAEGRSDSGGWRRPAILLRDAKRAVQSSKCVSHVAGARRKIAGRSHCRPGPLAVRSPSRRPCARPSPTRCCPLSADLAISKRALGLMRRQSAKARSGRHPPVRAESATQPGGRRDRRCADLR